MPPGPPRRRARPGTKTGSRALALPLLPAAAAAAAAAAGADAAFPGPGPWDGKAMAGAVLYLLLFAAGLLAILRLSRGAGETGPAGEAGGDEVLP
jgi:hypothetical protein